MNNTEPSEFNAVIEPICSGPTPMPAVNSGAITGRLWLM